jgi:hypothetical protein
MSVVPFVSNGVRGNSDENATALVPIAGRSIVR